MPQTGHLSASGLRAIESRGKTLHAIGRAPPRKRPVMPLAGCCLSGVRDAENAASGESRHGHNHPVRVGGSSRHDVEAVLIGKSDAHKVAA
jgi:hypothetical protein